MQDLTSDRIDGTTDLHDSYFINRPFDCSASCQTVGYDEESKTATFLISITEAGKRNITGDKITFIVKAFLSHKNYYDLEIPIDISDVEAVDNTQPVNSIGGGGRNYPFDGAEIPAALVPSEPTQNFPINGIELTGIGFIDGQLHIQTAVFNPLSNGNYSSFYLMNSDGSIVEYDYNFYFSNHYEQPEQRIDYCEFVFDITEEERSSFLIMGQFVTSDMRTEGDWSVTFPLDNNVPDESPVAINRTIANDVLSSYIADGGLSRVVLPENSERLDVGGNWEIITVPGDFYEREGTMTLVYLYHTNVPVENQPLFNGKTARLLNGLLADKVFTEDGVYFELLVPVPGLFSNNYRADDKGNILYNAEGQEIGSILFETTVGSDQYRVHIWTKDELEKQFGFNSTYEEAAALLGKDFRLPTVHIKGLELPEFQLTNKTEAFIVDSKTQELLPFEEKRVQVSFGGSSGNITIERARDDSHFAAPWPVPGGVIEELEIAGTKVHKVTSSEGVDMYVWVHDGLVYIFRQFVEMSDAFTEEQCKEIIASMIE